MKRKSLLLCSVLIALSASGQTLPYQNPGLSSEERAKDLVSRLTLEEKAKLMFDRSEAIPRLGIKTFNWWSEALHGAANQGPVTVFPEPIGMAAAFNDSLVLHIFDAVSDEMRAIYHDRERQGIDNTKFRSLSVWTPNVNIFRDPRWGRGQETYGEDPYLTSRMGVAVVTGLQGPRDAKYRKLLACAKHYAVHSGPEWNRHTLNLTDVSPRDLFETYLPAFKSLVQEADVRQVMCAYQRLDDDPCCGNNRLLQVILRDDWGYQHMVVSDCDAVSDFWRTHKSSSDATHASAVGVLAGTDVECSNGRYTYESLPDAVRRGLISEEEVNTHVIRLLKERFDLGNFDDNALVPWAQIPMTVVNSKEHKQMALDMARQSMTLLQNNDNILPLKKGKIAVIGPNADDENMMWGNYNGTPAATTTILEGIQAKVGKRNVRYIKGCDIVEDYVINSLISECSIDGKPGIKATYWDGREQTGTPLAVEQYTAAVTRSAVRQQREPGAPRPRGFNAKFETVYTAPQDGEVVAKLTVIGSCTFSVNGEELQRASSWRPVPVRVPIKVEKGKTYKIEVSFTEFMNYANANFSFDFGKETPVDYALLVAQLKGYETVVFVGGISSQLEGEEMPISLPGFKGGDRTNIELPASQRRCLQVLKDAGKKIVFVNCSGSAIALLPESKNCEAILQAWYSGQEGGQAVAEVLFGDYNPAGKLPVTFYKSSDQLPDFEDYSMKGRTYRYMTDAPLFPFGYGLSYTTFEVGQGNIANTQIRADQSTTLTVPVTNTGKRKGTEIVQVYVRRIADADGPQKSLRAFQRVEVPAGKSVNATLDLPYSAFECFDPDTNTMHVMEGNYEVLYGTSSDSKDLKKIQVTVN
ncbi:MAG: glycoside hydrolase family 3 C-terminal domain-containing protein [Prevotellaceae bacterium]|jgi:beta-glucosidase|nr:glycoside hydrolase family 3 C-terminal domain-containing protein [Prevotellaceae bacterium]